VCVLGHVRGCVYLLSIWYRPTQPVDMLFTLAVFVMIARTAPDDCV